MSEQPGSIVEAFGALLPDLASDEVPMLLAILERIAGTKYRSWAQEAADDVERAGLLACAEREDEIAVFIESLEDDATARAGKEGGATVS